MRRSDRYLTLPLVLLALGACGKKTDMADRVSADEPSVFAANDSGFTGPDTLHAGLNHIVFENHGTIIHEMMFIRLPEGMSAVQYAAQVAAGSLFPEGARDYSGPGLTSPGERVELWVTLDPGQYVLGCWLNLHVARATPRTLVVAGEPRTLVTPPREDVVVRMIDFRYEVIGKLERGTQTLKFETIGPSMHETDIYRLDGGRTVEDLKAWYQKDDQEGPPPAAALSGVLDSHDIKQVVWLRRDFPAGTYVFYCSMPMLQQGNTNDQGAAADVTHAHAGMVHELVIE